MGKLNNIAGFEWDAGNIDKNWVKHGVSNAECEEVFFNTPLLIRPDSSHSQEEARNAALGRTDAARPLFVVFLIRNNFIRVISARDMTDKELEVYRDRLKKSSKI
ncbi:MAG TPA: BrnT family toxin [Desulfuromonadales bacterium]|nr:BrnT family toxin [Desulfuromonadales bacterium]